MAPQYHARIASLDAHRQTPRSDARDERLGGTRRITSFAMASAVTRRLTAQILCQPARALGALSDASWGDAPDRR